MERAGHTPQHRASAQELFLFFTSSSFQNPTKTLSVVGSQRLFGFLGPQSEDKAVLFPFISHEISTSHGLSFQVSQGHDSCNRGRPVGTSFLNKVSFPLLW